MRSIRPATLDHAWHMRLPVANKGHSDWGYATVPIVGPLIGGALAGWLMRVIGF
jgi:glycerol uptake facilitator protein